MEGLSSLRGWKRKGAESEGTDSKDKPGLVQVSFLHEGKAAISLLFHIFLPPLCYMHHFPKTVQLP